MTQANQMRALMEAVEVTEDSASDQAVNTAWRKFLSFGELNENSVRDALKWIYDLGRTDATKGDAVWGESTDQIDEGRPQRGDWIVMPATRALFNKNKVTMAEMVSDQGWGGDMTIMVVKARKYTGTGNEVPVFIIGSGQHAYGEVGEGSGFTIDTGNGYGASGRVTVENYVMFDKDGNVVDKANDIGLNEKRPAWTFK